MSGHRCFTGDELMTVLEAPADDPRRLEAEACPRCAAEILAHARFLESNAAPEGTDLPEARRRLEAFVARDIIGEPAPGGVAGAARAGAGGRRWWQVIPRPAWALAAVIGGLAIALVRLQPHEEAPIVLRGGTERGSDDLATGIAVLPPTLRDDGGVTLRWRSVAGADGYEVSLLTAALEPSLSRRTARDTTLDLDAAALHAAARGGQVLYWTVAAAQDGRVEGRSAPHALRVR